VKPVAAEIPLGTIKVGGKVALVGCGEQSALELLEVQVEAKKRLSGQDFVNGYRLSDGEVLGANTP